MDNITEQIKTDSKVTIVSALKRRTEGMSQEDTIIHAYNSGIQDGVEYMHNMAKSNPQYRLPFESLAYKFLDWLL